MSLKGPSPLKLNGIRREMRERWEKKNVEEQEIADKFLGGFLQPERDRYEQFLCEEILNAREQADKKHLLKLKKQRNVCAVLLVAAVVLGGAFSAYFAGQLNESELGYENGWYDGVSAGRAAAEAGYTVTPPYAEAKYIASKASDKYHLLSCEYAERISEDNRIYYETKIEAEEDGKSPCSVCLPENSADTFTSGYYEARERLMGKWRRTGISPGPLFVYQYGLFFSLHPLLVLCQR